MYIIIQQIIGYTTAGDSFPVTSNYVDPASNIIQGSYLDVPLMRKVKSFDFLLSGSGYVGLSEIEIYADGATVFDR